MAPENALVFVAEDSASWQATYKRVLPAAGHQVVATATSLVKASEAIPTLAEQGVQVAIVDGNLGLVSMDGEDGAIVVERLRAEVPGIKIVGVTSDPDGVRGADVNIRKSEIDPTKLNETITGL
ncbi:MAG: response regulator [Candidatus Levybacteria bacterium]|nr:response regulator [Candidatus Levybacteria bacterium]